MKRVRTSSTQTNGNSLYFDIVARKKEKKHSVDIDEDTTVGDLV